MITIIYFSLSKLFHNFNRKLNPVSRNKCVRKEVILNKELRPTTWRHPHSNCIQSKKKSGTRFIFEHQNGIPLQVNRNVFVSGWYEDILEKCLYVDLEHPYPVQSPLHVHLFGVPRTFDIQEVLHWVRWLRTFPYRKAKKGNFSILCSINFHHICQIKFCGLYLN